jgi:hypothetical protein
MAHPQAPASHATARSILVTTGAVLMALGSTAFAAAPKPEHKVNGPQLPAKVRFIDSPSSESPAARKKRLKVECKGRPNAGACLGHTR